MYITQVNNISEKWKIIYIILVHRKNIFVYVFHLLWKSIFSLKMYSVGFEDRKLSAGKSSQTLPPLNKKSSSSEYYANSILPKRTVEVLIA